MLGDFDLRGQSLGLQESLGLAGLAQNQTLATQKGDLMLALQNLTGQQQFDIAELGNTFNTNLQNQINQAGARSDWMQLIGTIGGAWLGSDNNSWWS